MSDGWSSNNLWPLILLLDVPRHCPVPDFLSVMTPTHQPIAPGIFLPLRLVGGHPGETGCFTCLLGSTGSTCFAYAACHGWLFWPTCHTCPSSPAHLTYLPSPAYLTCSFQSTCIWFVLVCLNGSTQHACSVLLRFFCSFWPVWLTCVLRLVLPIFSVTLASLPFKKDEDTLILSYSLCPHFVTLLGTLLHCSPRLAIRCHCLSPLPTPVDLLMYRFLLIESTPALPSVAVCLVTMLRKTELSCVIGLLFQQGGVTQNRIQRGTMVLLGGREVPGLYHLAPFPSSGHPGL